MCFKIIYICTKLQNKNKKFVFNEQITNVLRKIGNM